jgi:UPF0716 family protein affecting phage T7 exclusion
MQANRIFFNWNGRPGCWIPLVVALPGVLVGLVLLAIAGFQQIQQQGYRSGQCTITAKQLQHELSTTTSTTSNGNTTTRTTSTQDVYAPYFEYRVRTADGQSYSASGYDGSNSYTSDRAAQQAIVDRYSVGQSYPCWYNPARPTQAVLIRQLNWVLIVVGGIFLLVSLFIASIGLLIARTSTQGAAGGGALPDLGRSSDGSQNDDWPYTPQSSPEYEPQEEAEEQPEQEWTDWHEEDWREQ